ncbi:MAG: UDP-glucose/GDP-mannose dehydrogenase family protein [Actinomycetota bacterium]|nr:UDP-glucose/GDP-mannose dehydrogenase family protein [Actinomycetota bacterium]
MSNIAVVGTGYVGLAYAAALADLGHRVTALDVLADRIAGLQTGTIPFYEPGLAELVGRGNESGRLRFSTDFRTAVGGAEFVFLCVGTPPLPNGDADMRQVESAATCVGASLSAGRRTLIINKSTMPPGSADLVTAIVRRHAPDAVRFEVVSNPEFLREGSALHDIRHPDRIVLGADNPEAADVVAALYEPIGAPVLVTDRRAAEMMKYAANAFLATKISFINEIAQLCEEAGVDVNVVAEGIGMDFRIGHRFLHAGLGFGGSCFPKDVAALIRLADRAGLPSRSLRSTLQINEDTPVRFLDRAERMLGEFDGRLIGVWGLSFKEETDDIRNSPAIVTIKLLEARGARVQAYDPAAMVAASPIVPEVAMTRSAYEAAAGADAVLLATPWNEFRQVDLRRVAELMSGDVLLDGRNLYDPRLVAEARLRYLGIGRGVPFPTPRRMQNDGIQPKPLAEASV